MIEFCGDVHLNEIALLVPAIRHRVGAGMTGDAELRPTRVLSARLIATWYPLPIFICPSVPVPRIHPWCQQHDQHPPWLAASCRATLLYSLNTHGDRLLRLCRPVRHTQNGVNGQRVNAEVCTRERRSKNNATRVK